MKTMASQVNLALLLLLFLYVISSVTSQSSRVGALGNKQNSVGSTQTSMVLPAVLQVLQSMSDQVEDLRGGKKETPKAGISGRHIPPYLLRVLVLRNSLITAAKKRKMSNFSGYSEDIMPLLVESSKGTAGQQLRMLLAEMLDRKELTSVGDENAVRELARTVVMDLEKEDSDLNKILEPLQPVKYSVD